MFRRLPQSAADVVGYGFAGAVSEEDVAAVQADIAAAQERHGTIRLLVHMEGLEGVEPAAVWQDLRMVPDYIKAIDRLAVVGDARWHQWTATLSEAVTEAEHFPPDRMDRAWTWLRAR